MRDTTATGVGVLGRFDACTHFIAPFFAVMANLDLEGLYKQ